MRKTILGLLLLASSVSFANSNVEEKKKNLEGKKEEPKTEKPSSCSVQISPNNTLTLNCGTCSPSDCLARLTAIVKNMQPHLGMEE